MLKLKRKYYLLVHNHKCKILSREYNALCYRQATAKYDEADSEKLTLMHHMQSDIDACWEQIRGCGK